MKIVFTGGGTGGHFYPIIAVGEAVLRLADKEHLIDLSLYYISDSPYNKDLLTATRMQYIEIKTGKRRTYWSIKNFTDPFKVILACITSTWKLFSIYPDVVFGKGGYASFPTMFAARVLRIPVIIHESDISLGRVNRWIEPYAQKIAISYAETAPTIHKAEGRVALTGIPLRQSVLDDPIDDPISYLRLEEHIPVLLVLGGSQGAENINEHLMDIMPRLVEKYQVIHQTGEANIEWMKKRAEGVLYEHRFAYRYKPYAYLDSKTLRLAAAASSLVISRSGSTIFEIAIWGKPSILIPLPIAREDHQKQNAYSYARTGAAMVIEEANLKNELLFSAIETLMNHPEQRDAMAKATVAFAHRDAAEKIAQALINVGLRHEG